MKKSILLICLLTFSYFKSIAVTATVGGTGSNFATLKAAFDAINNGTLTGNVILQITGNTTETSSASLNASGSGAANYIDVVVYPTIASVISGNLNNNLITLNSADHVTIDGRIYQTGSSEDLEISNSSYGTGASTITFQNSATYNTIQYVKLTGLTTSTDLGVVSFLNAGTGTGNDNNNVQFCDITGLSSTSTPRNAIFSDGTFGAGGEFNDSNVVVYNKIYDFFNSPCTGIYLRDYNSHWFINNNSLYQTTSRVGGTIFLLRIESQGTASTGGGFQIINNKLGGTDAQAGGTFVTTGKLFSISITNSQVKTVFQGNLLRGFNYTSTSGSTSPTISITGNIDFANNTIQDILNTSTTLNSGSYYFFNGSASVTVENNNFSNIDYYNSSTPTTSMLLINNIGNVNNNRFENFYVFSGAIFINNCDTVNYNVFRNIWNANLIYGANVASFNDVNNIRTLKVSSSTAQGIDALEVHHNIIKNWRYLGHNAYNTGVTLLIGKEVYNNYIECDSAVTGKFTAISGTDLNAYNNLIKFRFDTVMFWQGSTIENLVLGVNLGTTSNDSSAILNNTIIIEGQLHDSGSPSACIKIASSFPSVLVKNNLFVISNLSAANASESYCIYSSGSLNLSLNTDYNNFYFNGSDANLAKVSSTVYSTLLSWQNYNLQEFNSISVDPLFYNTSQGNIYGYIPQGTMQGTPIAIITTDILGNTRGNPPTMGAIETGACQPVTLTIYPTSCQSYTLGGQTFTSSGTYNVTVNSTNGCDTIYTINLTITGFATGTATINSCGSYTWIDGNTYSSSTNTATYTIVGGSVNGCDSLVTLNLIISSFVTGTNVVTTCGSYTWIDGNIYSSSNNTATFNILGGSVNGCDSIVTLNLTINTPNTTVTQGVGMLTANSIGAAYQWLDCDNGFAAIAGETNQSYTPTLSGNYAASITENGCADTSVCFNVFVVGLNTNHNIFNIRIYPNPANHVITIQTTKPLLIEIYSLEGNLVESIKINATSSFGISNLAKGVYLVKATDNIGGFNYHKLVKQ